MNRNTKLHYFSFPLIIIGMVALLLFWGGNIRQNNYLHFQEQLASKSVNGASNELHLYISELRRSIRLFATQERILILQLANNELNSNIHQKLEQKIRQHFPEYFSFTIASKEGISLLEGFDQLVGNGCKKDLAHFANDLDSHQVYVHSSPNNNPHHFDLMVPLSNKEGIFFISFNLKNITQILKNSETINHSLLLLKNDIHGVVEVTSQGSTKSVVKNNLSWLDDRNSMGMSTKLTLNSGNKKSIASQSSVAGTLWTLIDIPHVNLYSDYNKNITIQHLSVLFFFCVAIMIMSYFLFNTNRKLLIAMDDLQVANHQKSKLFSIIGHDLRGPFHPILSFSQILINNADNHSPVEVVKHATFIKESSKHILELLEDLLNWAKIQNDEYPIVIKEIQVKDIVMKTIDLYYLTAESKGCSLQYENENDNITVLADINALNTIIRNLVSNAIKFTNSGAITIGAIVQKNDIEIYVKDSGVGMDKETCQKLFDVANYHTTIGTSGEKGTGLGLSLCKELAIKQNGNIDVVSTPGHGSTFSIYLPHSNKIT